MDELFARVGEAEFDDAMALLERAYGCIDRAAASLEDANREDVIPKLNLALSVLRNADEELH